jgi:hypothetical protein
MRSFVLFVGVLLLLAWSGPADAQLIELYMKGYAGPYHARIVDAETKAPLAGVAVLVIWEYDKIEFLHTRVTFHDAREAQTDANGEFVLDVPEVEKHLPARTLRPRFVLFKPGYASSQGHHTARGETVELRPLQSRKQRLEVIRNTPPGGVPDDKMPGLITLMNVERRALGLDPTHIQGGK